MENQNLMYFYNTVTQMCSTVNLCIFQSRFAEDCNFTSVDRWQINVSDMTICHISLNVYCNQDARKLLDGKVNLTSKKLCKIIIILGKSKHIL